MAGEQKYYHYTSQQGLTGILESGKIKQSTRSGGDAVYGPGTYITTKHPDQNTPSSIAQNNYDGATRQWQANRDAGKADYAIELKDASGRFSNASGAGRDVYVHPGDIDVRQHGTGKVFTPDGRGGYQHWNLPK